MFDVYFRRRFVFLALVATMVVGGLRFSTASHGADRPTVYRVQAGDTLWGIATRQVHGDPRAGVGAIRDLNGLRDATVHVGQRLLVPEAA